MKSLSLLFGLRSLTWLLMIVVLLASEETHAVEIRTYHFNSSGTYPYSSSCGECSLTYSIQADIAGSFTVAIDTTNQRGVLLDLSAKLTKASELATDVTYAEELSHSLDNFVPESNYGEDLSFDWLIGEQGWKGVLSIEKDVIELTSPPPQNRDGGLTQIVLFPSYSIAFEKNLATFAMSYPAIDSTFEISQLRAIQRIPEPSTVGLTSLAMLIAIASRKRLRHSVA